MNEEIKEKMLKKLPLLKFDRWWTKLTNTKSGDLFTTIRRFTESKLEYYWTKRGKIFTIEVSDNKDGFKGFKEFETYLILLFEVTETFNNKVSKARLLQVFQENNEEITEWMKNYDTRYFG